MDITKILNTNRVILDMQATNKAEAIEELTNLLKKMVRSIVGKPLLKMSGSAKRKARLVLKIILRSRMVNLLR
ncbi:phosphotransferase system (PTS), fructose-specific [Escherichia coli]|nr:phosphotransferase system (PTS), fructose-specific [Escherichia coli]